MLDKNGKVPEVSAKYRQQIIDNQGPSYLCSAYTMCNKVATRIMKRTGQYTPLSPAAFYGYRPGDTLFRGEGMVGRDTQQLARKVGFIPRELFPIENGTYAECLAAFMKKEELYKEQAVAFSTDGFAKLNDIYELAQYIKQEEVPTWIAFDVYSNITNAATSGVVPIGSGTLLGGHAVLAHDVLYHNGQCYVKFANTWSKEWGEGGWGYLPASMLKESWGDFDRSPIDELNVATEIIFFTKDIDASMNRKTIWTNCKTLDFPVGYGAVADKNGRITITEGQAITFLENRSMVCINPMISAIGWTLEYFGDYFIMTKGKTEGRLRKELGLL